MSLFDQIDTAGYDPSKSFTDNLIASMPPTDLAAALGINDIGSMNAPAAPQFGAGATPFQFPQSAAFGAPLPAPAAPAVSPAVANANAQADDDDTPAAPQNAPIPVGNVMMPRIGGGFNPSTAPAQQPAPAAAPSPLDTVRSHLDAAAQSFGHGGGLIGGTAALITGQRHDPWNEAQQQRQAALQKQYQAYIGTGVFTPQEAQIATINPEAAKVLIAQKLGADKVKFAQLKDGLGAEHPAFINTSDQTINGQSIADYNKSNASTEGGGALGDTTKSGAEYLATLPPQIRGTVLAVAEGRQAPPTGFAASKPYWSKTIIPAVQQYDPSFDATNWGGRVAGVKDFSSGKSAETVKSLNQAIAHIGSLMGTATALNNGDYPALNWIENNASEVMGSGTQGSFRTNANAVADEVGKFFKSGNLSDHEIQEWKNNISENMSPAQQRAQIGKLAELMHGGIDALDEKRLNSIGPMAAAKQGPLVKPEAQKILQRIDDFTKGSDSGATSAVNPSAVEAEMKRRGLLQ